jgi:hypothetical protein
MMKRIFLLTISLVFLSLLSMTSGVFAALSIPLGEDSKLSELEQSLTETAFNEIKQQIIADYEGLYKFDHFDYSYGVSNSNGEKYITIDVEVDMTLIRHPLNSPFVAGMKDAVNATSAKEEEYLQKVMDEYVSEIETLYYNIPNRSTFTYAINVTDALQASEAGHNDLSSALYYRTDGSEEILLVKAEDLADPKNEQTAYQNGYEMIQNSKNEYINEDDQMSLLSTVTYDRIKARDWAHKNVDAAPEYPSSTVPGTDCANFVSKAINAGGIPQDKAGKWYQASTWGGWPGDHWFRTGYNKSTGVVIYMTNKGYFYKESTKSKIFAGSIMYWNNESHVALVTYGDGTTIKYTEHGAKQRKDVVYKSENASFYMPKSSILK